MTRIVLFLAVLVAASPALASKNIRYSYSDSVRSFKVPEKVGPMHIASLNQGRMALAAAKRLGYRSVLILPVRFEASVPTRITPQVVVVTARGRKVPAAGWIGDDMPAWVWLGDDGERESFKAFCYFPDVGFSDVDSVAVVIEGRTYRMLERK